MLGISGQQEKLANANLTLCFFSITISLSYLDKTNAFYCLTVHKHQTILFSRLGTVRNNVSFGKHILKHSGSVHGSQSFFKYSKS